MHDLQTVVTVKQDRRLGDLTVGSTKLLYVGIGQVRGGIDLAELTEADFSAEAGRLTVRLPAPRILDKLDVELLVYDQRRSLGPLDAACRARPRRPPSNRSGAGPARPASSRRPTSERP